MDNIETAKAIYSALHEGNLEELNNYLLDKYAPKAPQMDEFKLEDRTYFGKDELGIFFREIVQAPNIQEFSACTFIENGNNVVILNKVLVNLDNSEAPLENDVMHIATFEDGKLKQIKSMAWN